MDRDCRRQWDTFVREWPSVDDDYDAFINWTRNLVADGAHFESCLYERYETARQREGQSPTDFDDYLSTFEREIIQVSDKDRANRFLAKLRPGLRAQIKIDGMAKLPDTRRGIVALAQRVFEGIQTQKPGYAENRKGNLRCQTSSRDGITGFTNGGFNCQSGQVSASSVICHPWNRFRGRGRKVRSYQDRSHRLPVTGRTPKITVNARQARPENRSTLRLNKRKDRICFGCGSAGHLVKDCRPKR
jgi:hypothetical protein